MPRTALRNRILLSVIFSAASIVVAVPRQALAREIQGRLGLGYNSQFANAYPGVSTGGFRFPGISLKYGLTRDFAVAAIGGISTGSPGNNLIALKAFKNIYFENHLNFYCVVGAGLLNVSGQSGLELQGGFGVEFFIPGIESLGLSVETGFSFDNANSTGGFVLRTMGVSFLDAGIHFYF